MDIVTFKLASTEFLDGEKRRIGDEVSLPADHPVAVKTLPPAPTAAMALPAKPKKEA